MRNPLRLSHLHADTPCMDTPVVSLGGVGAGSPPHVHDEAWNVLVFGRKRWFFVPSWRSWIPRGQQEEVKYRHVPGARSGGATLLKEAMFRSSVEWFHDESPQGSATPGS